MILEISPDAPLWMRAAAASVLVLHIGGGTLGLVSGAVALAARKGGRLHRAAGTVFVVSMLTMAAIGATMAPLIHQRSSTLAGVLTFYLVASSWAAVRRPVVGVLEVAGLLVAITAALTGMVFIRLGQASPNGMLDGQPAQANYLFVIIGVIAAAGDLNLILRGEGARRIARHLWRMCIALFVASASLFLGQPQVFPEPLRGSPILFLPVLAPIVLMIFWLLRTRLRPAPVQALKGMT